MKAAVRKIDETCCTKADIVLFVKCSQDKRWQEPIFLYGLSEEDTTIIKHILNAELKRRRYE